MDATRKSQSSSDALTNPLGATVNVSREAPLGPVDTNPALSFAALNEPAPRLLLTLPANDASGTRPAPGPEPLRVLLVDDHDDMLNMMRLIMARQNYLVATANSGVAALQLMATFTPHVVISDISMPHMDGYELMTALRAGEHGTTFKSIALSGYGMEDDRQRAQAAGYDAHLTKPIDFDVLFALVARLVEPESSST